MADFSPIDQMSTDDIIDRCVDGAIMPTIERLYRTKGAAEAFEFIQGIILGLAGAAYALGEEADFPCTGDDALKILVNVINDAADADALDERPRS